MSQESLQVRGWNHILCFRTVICSRLDLCPRMFHFVLFFFPKMTHLEQFALVSSYLY